jgi:hypothetical protein
VILHVIWGGRKVVNGVTKTGSSLLHCPKKNVRKEREGTVTGIGTAIEIGIWTEETTGTGTWIAETGMNGPRDQIVVTVGLPEILEHPGILPEMTSWYNLIIFVLWLTHGFNLAQLSVE